MVDLNVNELVYLSQLLSGKQRKRNIPPYNKTATNSFSSFSGLMPDTAHRLMDQDE